MLYFIALCPQWEYQKLLFRGLRNICLQTLAQVFVDHWSTRTSFPGIAEPVAVPFPVDIIFARGMSIAELRTRHSALSVHCEII